MKYLGRTTNTLLTRGEAGLLREVAHLVRKVGATGSIKVSVKESGFLGTWANRALFGSTVIETNLSPDEEISIVSKEEIFPGRTGEASDTVNVAKPPVSDEVSPTIG